ncbi:T9SS type A sorting domain-containing protein [Hymenobacter sp. UV11]|uniref:T9SS type A sorting domain-containing protein n=1 Tax=Hymenobacter sp. UV11 TaxID=1849735 RepID=UPI0014152E30|nr:T9SS type A sorting domain-containing protein [Hymenobacter sp. UV11]
MYAGPLTTATGASQVTSACPNPNGRQPHVFPTPSTKFHVLSVADATGRTVLTRSYGNTGAQNTLDTSGLGSGIYVVRLMDADFTQSFKMTKE